MPQSLFLIHRGRTDVETLGEGPAEFIHAQSGGQLNYSWPAQVNRSFHVAASISFSRSAKSSRTKL
jgi:hypothetical protein